MRTRFKVGTRVVAYDYKGQRYGKGKVTQAPAILGIRMLPHYIKVRLDDTGQEMAFRADRCKRLVKKPKPPEEPSADAATTPSGTDATDSPPQPMSKDSVPGAS